MKKESPPWWESGLPKRKRAAKATPPPSIKAGVIGLFTLACIPLLYQTSTMWPVLLVFMLVASFQQARTASATWVRMVEQAAWLLANLTMLVLFPRIGDVGHLSLSGLAQMGVLAWVMLAGRGQWSMMWVSLGAIFASLPVVGRVLDMDWLYWADLALGVGAIAIIPWLYQLSLQGVAAPPRSRPPLPSWVQWIGLIGLTVALAMLMGILTRPDYAFNLGPEDINQTGPQLDDANQIVFAVRIGKGEKPAPQRTATQEDWYWRGNVLYTLDGSQWRRPATGGYNANYPYPAHTHWKDPSLQFYMVTWAGPMRARVWLDRPVSTDAIDGGDVVLPAAPPPTSLPLPPVGPPLPPPPESFTRDGVSREDLDENQVWHPWFYPGIAALNAPIQDTGHAPEDLAWALNLTARNISSPEQARAGVLANPRTRQAAQTLYDQLAHAAQPVQEDVFVRAWLAYLDAHSVYDLERTAQGQQQNVADAFLFGSALPHGTCVDFATSTVVALRQVGIPARYVTGFHGATWNPYLGTWVVTSNQAHAWVEYYRSEDRTWVRVDPTQSIRRVIRAPASLSPFQMWVQSMTNRHLAPLRADADGRMQHTTWSWLSDVPLPQVHLTRDAQRVVVALIAMILAALGLRWTRQWRHSRALPMRELHRVVARAQRRLGRHEPEAARRSHEGLEAWAQRLAHRFPDCGDWRELARETQAIEYGRRPVNKHVLAQWAQVGRHVRKR